MAAPGMEKKDFKVSLEDNNLVISSQKEHAREINEEGYSRKEFSYQSFQWSFLLPRDVVNEEGITAKYENGLLQLRIPKKEEAKRKGPRLIAIN